MIDACRDAACLAHAIPGVSLRLRTRDRRDPGRGDRGIDDGDVLVSSTCLAAPLDPCRFRELIVAGLVGQFVALHHLASVEIAGGLVHLGGGIYQPSHPGRSDDRWFVSSLGHPRLVELLGSCPIDAADDAFSALVKPDADLLRSAVRVRCDHPAARGQLDELAHRLAARVLVDELIAATSSASPSPRRPT